MSQIEIRPTILEVPREKIAGTLEEIKPLVNSLHLDMEDGKFVPRENIFSPHLVSWIKETFAFRLDMHLMVKNPLDMISTYADVGVDLFSFHFESENRPEEVLIRIREVGKSACLALKIETSVALSKPYWGQIEEILLMSVKPGWGGQEFDVSVLDRIKQLKQLGYEGKIKVDGGVKVGVAQKAAREGASVLVAGTSLFESGNIESNYKKLVSSLDL